MGPTHTSQLFNHFKMSNTLYTFPKNPQADKVFVAAQYSGVEVVANKEFVYGTTNTSKDFLAKFPLGTLPAYESKDGVKLTSGNAIASYVGGDAIAGATAADRAQVQQFVNFADNHIYPAACTWLYPIYGYIQGPRKATPKMEAAVKSVLDVLERVLASRTFLVGNAVTFADISVAVSLLPLFRDVLVADFRAPYVNVDRYLKTLFAQPQFVKALGKVEFCEKPIAPVAFKAAGGDKKDNKKTNKKAEKKVEKKKVEKKGPSEAEQLEKARAEAEKAEAKKAKNASARVDGLPKSSFVLNDWKVFYSNNEVEDSMKYFKEHFDAEGWSLWKCDYMYNDELTRTFMSSNLIGGFFQRCDKLRKYTFASMAVFGDDKKSAISGIWLMRGQDILFDELGYNVDSPQYNFTKLDYSDAATQKMVAEHFSWEGEFADIGMPHTAGKIYK